MIHHDLTEVEDTKITITEQEAEFDISKFWMNSKFPVLELYDVFYFY